MNSSVIPPFYNPYVIVCLTDQYGNFYDYWSEVKDFVELGYSPIGSPFHKDGRFYQLFFK